MLVEGLERFRRRRGSGHRPRLPHPENQLQD
jgi:hypothetical protein